MILTSAQLQTLKAAIAAETAPAFVAMRNEGATSAMAGWYNANATPTEKAWLREADRRTIDESADYSAFDSLVAGKRDAWRIFLDGSPRDMSRAKNRTLVKDVWGNVTAGSISEAILTACTRAITRGEKVFGGSHMTTGTVTALRLDVEGAVTDANIVEALGA